LDKREVHLKKLIDQCLKEAKKASSQKNKKGALYQLKKKKMYEKELDQLFGKKSNLDMQILTLQGAATNKEVLQAMQQGAATLKQQVNDSDIDTVDSAMDEINEAMGIADELSEALAQSVGAPVDEEDLENELAELEDELAEEELKDSGIIDLPSVPSKGISVPTKTEVKEEPKEEKVQQTEEEKQLAELNAMMGM